MRIQEDKLRWMFRGAALYNLSWGLVMILQPNLIFELCGLPPLNYPFVMQAIVDLGYTGFVSHEYSPSPGHDPVQTLEKAIEICDV